MIALGVTHCLNCGRRFLEDENGNNTFTCEYCEKKEKELSADEILEELGYDKKNEDEKFITYLDSGNEDIYILFNKEDKVVDGYPSYDYFLDMPRLKAINKKVEELGW